MPRKPELNCFVCGTTENVVCTFPQTQETFNKWIEIFKINTKEQPIKPSDKKKLCVLHFDKKWKDILLQGNARSCAYIFPAPVSSNNESERSTTPTPKTLHNVNRTPTNFELLYKMKNDEVQALTSKIKILENENKALKKAAENTSNLESILNSLSENAATLIQVLTSKKGSGKRYSKEERILCQNLYYKNPGYYAFLRQSLDGLLPSKITMLRWQPIKTLAIGIVREIISYLKAIGDSLEEIDRKIVITLDEMDGRQGLRYDSTRDCIVGFETLIKTTPNLAKKFLTVMIRGLNHKLGNIIIANYATAKGITGTFFYGSV